MPQGEMLPVLPLSSCTWLVNILTCNHQTDDKQSSQVSPLIYCQVMSYQRGPGVLGGCQPGLPPLRWDPTGTQGTEEHRKGIREDLRAILSFYSEREELWNCQSWGPTLGLSLFSPAKLLTQLLFGDTLALSFSRGSSDVGLACLTGNKDFHQLYCALLWNPAIAVRLLRRKIHCGESGK